ncbi:MULTISPECIES: cytochrome d ubiquinol oxidase subunit II [unclassified Cocleimonas]|uniref:cytochrome d ubiquinol oxidase subunit II n=1 Tax=unclassified Cocleimonas TaxID=2639732 RepID=UPI002DBA3F53|nr:MULTISPECIES: cytochrome d ubiquinol oxidase subunit II [unclassified Cocleimonas]
MMEFIDYTTLKMVWWLLVGILWLGFAMTEGFDMGVGMLLPFVGKTDEERRVAINAVAPHWDGNQVWLILAAGAIFAAWPIVYATTFSGFYLALMLMLFSLFFRPVGFDYRSKLENKKWRSTWDWGLFISGIVPPLILGVAFGNLFLGVPFHYDDYLRSFYDGNFFGLLHPFAVLSGLLAISMFVMHGGAYLMMRCGDEVYNRTRTYTQFAAIAVIALFAIEGLWLWTSIDGYALTSEINTGAPANPLGKTVEIFEGAWLTNYTEYPLTMIAPIVGFVAAFGAFLSARARKAGIAFAMTTMSMFGIILTGAFSLFPFILPSSVNPSHSLTIWDAASSELTLSIMLFATLLFVPIILIYTVWCYVKLWGKYSVEDIRAKQHSLY